jgi:hypothetical protein
MIALRSMSAFLRSQKEEEIDGKKVGGKKNNHLFFFSYFRVFRRPSGLGVPLLLDVVELDCFEIAIVSLKQLGGRNFEATEDEVVHLQKKLLLLRQKRFEMKRSETLGTDQGGQRERMQSERTMKKSEVD